MKYKLVSNLVAAGLRGDVASVISAPIFGSHSRHAAHTSGCVRFADPGNLQCVSTDRDFFAWDEWSSSEEEFFVGSCLRMPFLSVGLGEKMTEPLDKPAVPISGKKSDLESEVRAPHLDNSGVLFPLVGSAFGDWMFFCPFHRYPEMQKRSRNLLNHPDAILATTFAFLSLHDHLFSCRFVCRQWRDVLPLRQAVSLPWYCTLRVFANRSFDANAVRTLSAFDFSGLPVMPLLTSCGTYNNVTNEDVSWLSKARRLATLRVALVPTVFDAFGAALADWHQLTSLTITLRVITRQFQRPSQCADLMRCIGGCRTLTVLDLVCSKADSLDLCLSPLAPQLRELSLVIGRVRSWIGFQTVSQPGLGKLSSLEKLKLCSYSVQLCLVPGSWLAQMLSASPLIALDVAVDGVDLAQLHSFCLFGARETLRLLHVRPVTACAGGFALEPTLFPNLRCLSLESSRGQSWVLQLHQRLALQELVIRGMKLNEDNVRDALASLPALSRLELVHCEIPKKVRRDLQSKLSSAKRGGS